MDRTVSGLIRKRAELSGERETAKELLSLLDQQIAALDAALSVFGYDHARNPIRPTYKREQGYFRAGELQRLILDILRSGPQDVSSIVSRILERKGIAEENTSVRGDIRKRVKRALKRMEDAGKIRGSEGATFAILKNKNYSI
ncbi:MAG: hypothetical protein JJ959_11660 [Nisaea sp.]|uniref:hypothetical protein n=1 Tax=Nisaea sp. TaxID=2024842 RepID=UPI001B2AFAAE|nr:hypothetical protein [Nisaea sp.]MBO6561189.1 hypothetical protein [Nisaea sp.]